jgi:penicillin-binding protein 2
LNKSIFGYLEGDQDNDKLRVKRNLAAHEEWTEAILPADAEAGAPEGETDKRPLAIFGGIVAIILVVLGFRLFTLQILEGSYNVALANGNRIREQVERAPRGIIYDRNMQVLAQNQPSYDVTVVPQLLPQDKAKRTAEYAAVGSVIGMSGADVQSRAETGCRSESLACFTNPVPQEVASNVSRPTALTFDQDSSQFPGFSLDVNPIRQYEDNNLLSAFLGYTGRVDAQDEKQNPTYGPTDLIGKLGLEKQYESVLKGINGGTRTEVDASGRPVRVLADRTPQAGDSLVLGVDMGLEQELASTIQQQMQAAGAQRAAGVAVNPETGEVLAAVSLPSYDNNEFSKGISEQQYQQLLSDPGQPLYNKVIGAGYPSGSIIKPIGAAGALQAGIITVDTVINDLGQLVVPNPYNPSAAPSIFHGWFQSGLGPVNVLQALAQSSDIFFYEIMGGFQNMTNMGFTSFTNPYGIERLAADYRDFGLGSLTGIDIPGESPGRVPSPEWQKAYNGQPWYTGETYNTSVGQGDLLVSPLQMVMAMSAIANGGNLLKPHLVDKIVGPDGKLVEQVKPDVIRNVGISQDNLNIVKQGMQLDVTEPKGTGCCLIKAQVPVSVAAKSGTAETVVHNDPTVPAALQSKPDAWFEAFAPVENPQIAIVVLIEHAGEGAQYAAPPVRESLAWYFTQGPGAGKNQ